ncbi:putative pet8 related protein [Neofusicoccum parvum]|uniref:Pet8 related protein n=2 Tax=Neofusicoccum parvum TaxID=310453 RepID=A0ACB5RRB0_9PEZI|nr:putative pet8 related protein [Neofusicoccum parvum UCRNP2]GME23049.1 putative pet8 related protein [Neofusicoccum parvum]GME50923.1 putative pet8 related protein [Neofusicoccum parvum]
MSSSQSSKRVESPFVRSLLAGAVAGTTVDLSLFPLDTLKTRLQASEGFIASGGFRGIYRGIGSTVVGSAPGAALFFVTYDGVKRSLARRTRTLHTADGTRITTPAQQGALHHMVAASLGEVAACAVRVPTEVVKQRAQASQHPSSLAALQHILAQRRAHGLVHVWKELYRGWGITIMREVPFTVIQFPLWEGMKEWSKRTNGKDSVTAFEGALFGSIAGAIAASITTPLDVLKTRMMLATQRQKVVPLLTSILKESGPRAFFAGIGPRVFWISTGGAVFLGSYQWTINALGGAS